MTTQDVKQLARYTAEKGKVDNKLANVVLTKLSRKELIAYAAHLKTLADKNTVRIQSQLSLPDNLKKDLRRKFEGKEVIFEINPEIDGVRAYVNDSIIDLTMSGFLDQTVEKLKIEI